MIDLTPLDVRQKKADFPKGLRGYDPGHVDDFLNLVADRLEALVKENRRLADEVSALRSSAGEYKDREKALTEALVSAQQMREEVREQSAKEADLLRREAVHEAQRLKDDALVAIEKEEETLRRLRARQRQLVEGYRSMLERELRELAVVAESLEAAAADGAREAASARGEGSRGEARRLATARGIVPPAVADAHADEADSAGEGMAEGSSEGPPPAADKTSPAAKAADGPAGATPAKDEPASGTEAPRSGDEAAGGDPWKVRRPEADPPRSGDSARPERDRLAAPAASAERGGPRTPERQAPDAQHGGKAEGGPGGREEPDWLAAILRED